MKSGNLNFLEPSGSLQAYNGTALPLRPFMWRWMFLTTQNNGQNVRLILITVVLPGMPHVYKTTRGEHKTFCTKLITVNFKQIDFEVNL